jgi:hypothetical protein
MKLARQQEWTEAKRRCRLSDEALAMAKELGLSPRSLTKNIPNRSEPWKAPVEDWVRRLHLKKFGRKPLLVPPKPPPAVSPSAYPASAPDAPVEPPAMDSPPDGLVEESVPVPPADAVNEVEAAQEDFFRRIERGEVDEDSISDEMERIERDTPMSDGEINDEDRRMLRRRDGFRRFAELFGKIAAKLDFVQRIVLFGSVAAPLKKEVPRFSRFRRAHVAVWHECKDVDLAIWVTNLSRLRELKRAVADATNMWQTIAHLENLPGVPHHQVDVFLLEPETHRYRGNLCHYGQCPKGKDDCQVTGCGAQPFLQLYQDFEFDRFAPLREPAVVLFDRISPDAKV